MKILLIGANGKMGKIVQKVCKEKNIETINVDIYDHLDIKYADCNVVLDFSEKNALQKNMEFCLKNNKNIVYNGVNQGRK